MAFIFVDQHHYLWEDMINYAKRCSWKTADFLADLMQQKTFSDWERILVAVKGDEIVGFCTLTKKDTYPELPYSPFIGFVFVAEQARGDRLSEQLISEGSRYLKDCGFETVYIVSSHDGLYEKFGFVKIDTLEQGNEVETVFSKAL
ncbi:MAG: GNAT family N-acetyltransferase [Alkalibacterium sp.]|nr:GNAT family N-acetyltransferase [Alkalibacterium sp.]